MKTIPPHMFEPWPETYPDRERIRNALIEGFQTNNRSMLTEAFRGLSGGERLRAWVYMTKATNFPSYPEQVEYARFVHDACALLIVEMYGPNVDPNIDARRAHLEDGPAWEHVVDMNTVVTDT